MMPPTARLTYPFAGDVTSWTVSDSLAYSPEAFGIRTGQHAQQVQDACTHATHPQYAMPMAGRKVRSLSFGTTTDLVFSPTSDVGWFFQPAIKDGAMFAGDWQDADQVTEFVAYLDQQQAQGFRLELSQDLGDWQFLAAGPVLYAGVALCHELQHTVQPLHLCN